MKLNIKKQNVLLIIVLVLVLMVTLIAHFILRPDRNAKLFVIYTGDMQGHFEYESGVSFGYGKIAALEENVRKNGHETLLLDSGNCLGGSNLTEMDNGQSAISVMNRTGYDAMIPAPLDFVYGFAGLSSLKSKAEFPMLAANIMKKDGSAAFETYKLMTIHNVRIAVVGVTDAVTETEAGRSGLVVEDMLSSIRNIIAQMKEKPDAVIVLAYTGDREKTKSIAGIDGVTMVIESGSEETYCEWTDDGVMIASSGLYGRNVGVAEVNVSAGTASVTNQFINEADYEKTNADENVDQAVVSAEQVLSESMNQVQGRLNTEETEETIDIEAEETLQEDGTDASKTVIKVARETKLGDLIADAMLNATQSDGAEVALIADSDINGLLSNGSVTKGAIAQLFDPSLYVVTCKMTGGEVRALIDDSFKGYPDAKNFLQVSGISYSFNAQTGIGSAISDVMIDSHELDDAKTYTVAMTSRMAEEQKRMCPGNGYQASYCWIGSIVSDYVYNRVSDYTSGGDDGENETDNQRIRIVE